MEEIKELRKILKKYGVNCEEKLNSYSIYTLLTTFLEKDKKPKLWRNLREKGYKIYEDGCCWYIGKKRLYERMLVDNIKRLPRVKNNSERFKEICNKIEKLLNELKADDIIINVSDRIVYSYSCIYNQDTTIEISFLTKNEDLTSLLEVFFYIKKEKDRYTIILSEF